MDYLNLLTELSKYYENLLIVQYNGLPRAQATIRLIVNLLWVNMILLQIRDAFDLRTATGAQLEIIGKWVGCDKFYNGQLFDFHPWFALIPYGAEYDNLQGGFSTYDNFGQGKGGFLNYDNIRPTQNQLVDDAFRIMIGLKIIKNNISATCRNIDEAIWEYFEGRVYTVWEPDELTYYYPSDLAEVIQVAADKKVLPCPTGVRLELREIIENEQ